MTKISYFIKIHKLKQQQKKERKKNVSVFNELICFTYRCQFGGSKTQQQKKNLGVFFIDKTWRTLHSQQIFFSLVEWFCVCVQKC